MTLRAPQTCVRILAKAIKELNFNWDAPDQPARSKLDSWYSQSSRCLAALRRRVPFFPDVHEQVVKSWSALQSAHIHSSTQAMFYHVDGVGSRRPSPRICAHLRPCLVQTSACLLSLVEAVHLTHKACSSAGTEVSVLHVMAVLQVFQAKLLQTLESSDIDVVKDLHTAADFALMSSECSAQFIGQSMADPS
ncbi:guanylate cyclase 2G-like protein [Labeo rohita]|uniref:Guanylate cyclase 2G-like protein n=1 Tax=Labeo rohita TaxID=84645 RepID=A0A498LLK0_LABRO|nr:guanylate cyclase 2G-like protein [Labeo rohita]RXN22956.1 guanylate cyclase 2G-like protein [Labeo rohita]